MNNDRTGHPPAGFSPGDPVKITGGTFVGMRGTVIPPADGKALWDTIGGEQPPSREIRGTVCVVLTLFGRAVPVFLFTSQLELDRELDRQ